MVEGKKKRPFDGYYEHSCRVSSTCTISYDRNRYSVPAEYARKPISVRVRATAIHIMIVADRNTIAEPQRHFSGEKQYLNPWHYLPLLERKPGALRNGTPFNLKTAVEH